MPRWATGQGAWLGTLLDDLTTALARVEELEEDGAMLVGELENTEKQLKECQGFIEDLFNGAQKRFPSEYEAVDDDECECSAEDSYEHVIDAAMANKIERIVELEQQLAASQRQAKKLTIELESRTNIGRETWLEQAKEQGYENS